MTARQVCPITPPALGEWSRLIIPGEAHSAASLLIETSLVASPSLWPASDKGLSVNLSAQGV